MPSQILVDARSIIITFTHLVAHVLPIIVIPAAVLGFFHVATRKAETKHDYWHGKGDIDEK